MCNTAQGHAKTVVVESSNKGTEEVNILVITSTLSASGASNCTFLGQNQREWFSSVEILLSVN